MQTVVLYLIALLVVVVCFYLDWRGFFNLGPLFQIIAFLLIVIFGIGLLIMPVSNWEYRGKAKQYEAIKSTLEVARSKEANIFENAAITLTVVQMNQDIALAMYWNGTVFNLFIYDGFANLEPLK